jgi:hypothetical protein
MSETIYILFFLLGFVFAAFAAVLADAKQNILWYLIPCFYSLLFSFALEVLDNTSFDIGFALFYAIFLIFLGWSGAWVEKRDR